MVKIIKSVKINSKIQTSILYGQKSWHGNGGIKVGSWF